MLGKAGASHGFFERPALEVRQAMTTITRDEIVAGLRRLGLQRGHKVLVHSSLRSFGHVDGGADAVIDALLQTVGEWGTVLVPTLTGDETLSPANPPRFDPLLTPCWTGVIPETFRRRPSAIRSLHPTHSVAAIGADAAALTQDHARSITPCDEMSPYGNMARIGGAFVLLLGVSHECNTTMHHVEEMAGVDYHIQPGFAEATIIVGGQEVRRHVMLHKYGPARDFNIMEPVFVERGIQRSGMIGTCQARLVEVPGMVRLTLQALRADPGILCKRSDG
jgi:aminoglycoside 3-N-acetyltransferase